MAGPLPTWYMPGSVLSALWGVFMPRLAALVWKSEINELNQGETPLKWPPDGVTKQLVCGDTYAYPIEGKALQEFWEALATIAFGPGAVVNGELANVTAHTGTQRVALLLLEYLKPDGGPGAKRIQLRVIQGEAYDFVLCSNGLDIFIPRDPFLNDAGKADGPRGQEKVLQMYKFRETGKPPIGLPGHPSSFSGGNGSNGDTYLVPIPQLTAPTGAYQIQEDWVKGMAGDVTWWISGSTYRGMMAALPRVIANLWYEQVAWPKDEKDDRTTRARFNNGGLGKLLEERMETILPRNMHIKVAKENDDPDASVTALPGWNKYDVMITDKGMYFPDPGPAPSPKVLLDAIVQGQAGNPVFTDSAPKGTGGS